MVVIGRKASEFIAFQDGKGIECVSNHMTHFISPLRQKQINHTEKNTGTLRCSDVAICYSVLYKTRSRTND